MPSTTRRPDLGPLFLSLLFLLAALPAPGSVPGTVSGRASGWFLLSGEGFPSPPDVEVNGFRQHAAAVPGGYEIRTEVEASPLRVRAPFRFGRIPAEAVPDPAFRRALEERLRECQRADEALSAVLLTLRERVAYAERVPFEESPREVLTRGTASCAGFAAAAVSLLGALGIPARPVLGLVASPAGGREILEGGRLHALLEVDLHGAGTLLCDPVFSIGFVTHRTLVLRREGGLEPGPWLALKGAALTTLEVRDRLFFLPPDGASCLIWARPNVPARTGGAVTGKFLDASERPLPGRAFLEIEGNRVSIPLWEGNFFFTGLAPGVYTLRLECPSSPPVETRITVRAMDKRELVLYSRGGGERREERTP